MFWDVSWKCDVRCSFVWSLGADWLSGGVVSCWARFLSGVRKEVAHCVLDV